jgi:SAM-dependent methyltransferase
MLTPSEWIPLRFAEHYVEWRDTRIDAIRAHYGDLFFRGRTLLELGCGYGDIGARFAELGALVTCTDGRAEHLEVVRDRWPHLATVHANLDDEWPFGHFDIIFHLGVLYHLEETHASLRYSCRSAEHLVLETEVCNSSSPDAVVLTAEDGYDQSVGGVGCRPSAARLERLLAEEAMTFERVRDSRCNAGMHVYDWPVTESMGIMHGQRRFWFARKTTTGLNSMGRDASRP